MSIRTAPRTHRASTKGQSMTHRLSSKLVFRTLAAIALAASLPLAAPAQTLDRVRSAGKLVLGYEADARPFSFDNAGKPAGYAIDLCGKVADEVKLRLNLPDLAVAWVEVAAVDRIAAVRDGRIDLLCGADVITLSDSATVSFSLPVFPSGTGVVLRADAAAKLREVLTEEAITARPIWRGAPARTFLDQKTFSAVAGSSSEEWLMARMKTLELSSVLAPVASHDEGVARVLDGSSAAFFGPLPILLDAVARSAAPTSLVVPPRHFTYEPLGLVMQRGDAEFRLAVDTALSHSYRDPGFRALFTGWFGEPDGSFVTFFQQTALPD